jgi:hypothetical protein
MTFLSFKDVSQLVRTGRVIFVLDNSPALEHCKDALVGLQLAGGDQLTPMDHVQEMNYVECFFKLAQALLSQMTVVLGS